MTNKNRPEWNPKQSGQWNSFPKPLNQSLDGLMELKILAYTIRKVSPYDASINQSKSTNPPTRK